MFFSVLSEKKIFAYHTPEQDRFTKIKLFQICESPVIYSRIRLLVRNSAKRVVLSHTWPQWLVALITLLSLQLWCVLQSIKDKCWNMFFALVGASVSRLANASGTQCCPYRRSSWINLWMLSRMTPPVSKSTPYGFI